MPTLGIQELLIILLIVFFVFGAKRLPELGKGIGSAIKNFKGAINQKEEKELQENKEKENS
ncbi:MAG: twin-arginine translocase TatA/TatE family subunit [Acidobacteriia bacterium]|jgi:sec-independent protein translocase protein TatA|nr:twin-arginine translocase TatA/TatE family subunit [Terriglobia bacterium]